MEEEVDDVDDVDGVDGVDGVDEKEELKKVLHALEWIAKMRYGLMLRLFCGEQPCNRRIPHI